jgi:ribosome-associated toxin RatA of RatAB toxin-antitoxin module
LHGVLLVALGLSWSLDCKSHEPETAPPVTPSGTETGQESDTSRDSAETLAADSDEPDRQCEATIEAPIDRIRALVTDYDHYATNLPKFGRSKVLKRIARGAEVYLQVPLLHGAAHLWAVARFDGPIVSNDGERVEGNYTGQGNVSAFHCLWTYARVDDTHTQLHFSVLLLPKFPLPHSIIEKELNDACHDAVNAVKEHAEANH